MTPYMKTIFQQKKKKNFDQNQWVGPLKLSFQIECNMIVLKKVLFVSNRNGVPFDFKIKKYELNHITFKSEGNKN